jgi:hypothetical protein
MKSGNLNFLESSGSLQTCNGTALPSTDWVDSSGVRLYLTPTLRRFDGGVIELGLEYTDKMAVPPQQPAYALSGYCITECTAVVCRTYSSNMQFVLYTQLTILWFTVTPL